MANRERVILPDGRIVDGIQQLTFEKKLEKDAREQQIKNKVAEIMSDKVLTEKEKIGALEALQLTRLEKKLVPQVEKILQERVKQDKIEITKREKPKDPGGKDENDKPNKPVGGGEDKESFPDRELPDNRPSDSGRGEDEADKENKEQEGEVSVQGSDGAENDDEINGESPVLDQRAKVAMELGITPPSPSSRGLTEDDFAGRDAVQIDPELGEGRHVKDEGIVVFTTPDISDV